ncbi:aspartate ammonia-lyase [[Clostridium] hylemonae]|uniref:aspartate ammonia-lyase n=1 Tax=[Clostridium] hylemonae TaxID=89153 RepID=UPI001FCA63E4|nr:aspartate ammonia-lyase [[Clostridium] hylemonae]BDF04150.1 aspartate ammonia-lyase [[Clostridium] hylemonae]
METKVKMEYRKEKDSMGVRDIPREAYYGLQALRATENFPITGMKVHPEMIISLAQIKKAAAIVNCNVGVLDQQKAEAIKNACDEILSGRHHEAFIVDAIQGGAGTSLNMNANEVIANRAIELLGGEKGDYKLVHPNDDVNCAQSTNDVIPTAGKIATLRLLKRLILRLERLYEVFLLKAEEFDDVIKMGRTQMQDAVPIRLGQEFHAYAAAVKKAVLRIDSIQDEVRILNLGGTAIGTGMNADKRYLKEIVPELERIVDEHLVQSQDLIEATQNADSFVSASGAVKSCAVALSKIASDLRLMSSGPQCGFGEINLPVRQSGSSIMPGKINPVIPEVMNQVAFNVIGNDFTITMAAEAGQLELNAFVPVMLFNLFQSIDTLSGAVSTFTENCIIGITANVEHCKELVEHSVGVVTAICPYVGYSVADSLAKEAVRTGQPIRELILKNNLLNEEELNMILDIRQMTTPGIPGKVYEV